MKPSIAELINAAGYDTFTPERVNEASRILYGDIGAGLDRRDWNTILSSGNAFEAAQTAHEQQYQSPGFLLENAEYLQDKGYSPAQIENTYRQMQAREGYADIPKAWAAGTPFEDATQKTDAELAAQLRSENRPSPPTDTPAPTASNFTATATTVGATSNEPGKLGLYDGSDNLIGDFEADFTAGSLTQAITVAAQGSVTAATLKVADEAGNVAAETQSVILGTASGDYYDSSQITGTADNDYIYGFGGGDRINGGAGKDTIILTEPSAAPDTVTLNSGESTIDAFDTIIGFDAVDGRNADSLNFQGTTVQGASSGIDVSAATTDSTRDSITGSTNDGIITLGGADATNVDSLNEWIEVAKIMAASEGQSDDSTGVAIVGFEFSGNTYVLQERTVDNNGVETTTVNAFVELVGLTGISAVNVIPAPDTIDIN